MVNAAAITLVSAFKISLLKQNMEKFRYHAASWRVLFRQYRKTITSAWSTMQRRAIHQAAAKTSKNNEAKRPLASLQVNRILRAEQSGKQREARAQTQSSTVRTSGGVFTASVTSGVLDFNKVVATSNNVGRGKIR